MPAFSELPMIRVVQPAYHCFPNGGHGSFFPSANLRLSCDRVFATSGRSGTWIGRGYFRLRTFGGVCYCYMLSQSVMATHDTRRIYIFLQLLRLRQLRWSALRLATELSTAEWHPCGRMYLLLLGSRHGCVRGFHVLSMATQCEWELCASCRVGAGGIQVVT
jgi:hypothetical protein